MHSRPRRHTGPIQLNLRIFKPLLWLLLAFATISFAAIFYFKSRFGLAPRVLPAHVLLVLAALLAVLFACAAFRTLIPLWAFAASLYLLYAVNLAFSLVWIDSVSLRLVAYYAAHFHQLLPSTLAFSKLWLLAAFLAACLPLVALLAAFAAPLRRALSCVRSLSRPVFAHSGLALAIYAAAFASVYAFAAQSHRPDLAGEPLLSLTAPVRPARSQLPSAFYDPAPPEMPPGAYRVSRPPLRKNVIVIVVDALRADHLPAFGYPRDTTPLLTRRLQHSRTLTAQWATSACSISECGILSILTSRPFQRLRAGLFSLPAALEAAGFQSYYLVSGDFTSSYRGLWTLAAASARLFLDGLSGQRYGAWDDRVILEHLDRLPPAAETPAFFYFHLHSAHSLGPHFLPPTFEPANLTLANLLFAPADPERDLRRRIAKGDLTREILTNYYDNGVLQADQMVDAILESLRAKGYMESSVVVLTSDHGENLGEHGSFLHGFNLDAGNVNIPLIVFDSEMTANRTVEFATQLDIAPTIAALAGIPIPASWEGQSLLAGSPRLAFLQTTSRRPVQAVIFRDSRATYKYLFDTLDGREQLFELRADPGELHNLAGRASPSLLEFMRHTRKVNFGASLEACCRRTAGS